MTWRRRLARRLTSIVTALLLLLPAPALAQIMPDYGRPLSPAEARGLDAEIKRLSREKGVREATLVAIARAARVKLRDGDFASLVRRIEENADLAASLQTQLTSLQKQLTEVQAAALRTPAEQALARATAAFDAGKLDEADRELAGLETLRQSDSVVAQRAWLDAAHSREEIAKLQLDYDRAIAIGRATVAAIAAQRRELDVEQWRASLDVAKAEGDKGQIFADKAALQAAIASYRNEVLPLAPRAERPFDWAETQIGLGVALINAGEREEGSATLSAALAAFHAALEVYTREARPLDWATAQHDIGTTYQALSERDGGRAALDQAVAAFRAALEVRTRDRTPKEWSATQNNLGIALESIGSQNGDVATLQQAIAAFHAALTVRSREKTPFEWAQSQNNLGTALYTLGDRQDSTASYEAAATAFRAAMEVYTRDRLPQQWAQAQNNLGAVMWSLGDRAKTTAPIDASAAAFRSALEVYTRDKVPLDWAMTQMNLGSALQALGDRQGDSRPTQKAIAAFEAALEVYTRDKFPSDWAMTQSNLGNALLTLGKQNRDSAKLDAAIAAERSAQTIYKRETEPVSWAIAQTILGTAVSKRAELSGNCEVARSALPILTAALSAYSSDLVHDRAAVLTQLNDARSVATTTCGRRQ